jgi:NitT/TauT family transport system substrate-binding protein
MQIETTRWTRRGAIAGAASALFAAGTRSIPARAATRIRFLTDWFAEAEHGGFYQAKATGLYEKAGLDVDIQMGGPQINGIQLLAGGDADVIISYDMQVLDAVAKGVPAVAIAAVNQFDLEGIMTHGDVASLAALKGRRILISSTAYSSFWPWLKHKFGYTDEQTGPYTSDLQPFFADPTLSQQAYMTDEPFEAHRRGVATKFFLFADAGLRGARTGGPRGIREGEHAGVASVPGSPCRRKCVDQSGEPESERRSVRLLHRDLQGDEVHHRR